MKLFPKFEIFSGRFGEEDALWIETVEGLGNASDRMHALAKEKPGPYFVFHVISHQVLGSVDTTPRGESKWGVA